jgi:pyruvate dehydrogenase E1 component
LRQALKAQSILAEKYQISSDVWSVTSYTELRRDAQECKRWNLLHPTQPPRVSYVERALEGVAGPCVASSDNVRAVPEQINEWVPGGLYVLGTDGMGRSESRGALRRHFEVDAECITLATLCQLKKQGKCDGQCVANAVKDLGIDPEKISALYA